MKLSIVIPAYNVDQYITNCLDSIFRQQIPAEQLEVIVVNDGSTDGTEKLLQSFAQKKSNLKYINQENQGQSVARNEGLKRTTGDLIWYVDSDDAVTENSISTIFSYFEKYPNADFLTFDRIHYDLEAGTKLYCKSWGEKRIGWNLKKKSDIYEKPLDGYSANERLMASVPWFHVFKHEYLINNNLFFVPGLLNEDDELRMRLFFFAKEVRYIPFAHYVYSAMRPGSLTTVNQSFTMKSALGCIKTIESWKQFEKENVHSKEQKQYVNGFMKYTYQSLLLLAARKEDKELYSLYQTNKKEWRKGFKNAYWRSVSTSSFSIVAYVRYLITLYLPSYYEYTELPKLKEVFKRNK
jgi:glycosyltransferase involved in cell wall biosynthesis